MMCRGECQPETPDYWHRHDCLAVCDHDGLSVLECPVRCVAHLDAWAAVREEARTNGR